MSEKNEEALERLRQQYEYLVYPIIPFDKSAREDNNVLFCQNLVTSHYLRYQKVIDTRDKFILDVGCGSGWTSLVLAEANPGANIVGIDIAANSIKVARERLKYWGFGDNTEFHVMAIEDIGDLNTTFDYINCHDVLYMLPNPNPADALKTLKQVLSAQGIIRADLHSYHQREGFYRAQELFRLLGLMEDNPGEFERCVVVELMKALQDKVNLKSKTWMTEYEEKASEQNIMMNFLFQGDKGYNIKQMFAALTEARLEFISMVDWRRWELMDLFKDRNNLPEILEIGLAEMPIEEQLYMFELLQPIHRLIDWWCGHPLELSPPSPVATWNPQQWLEANVHLHPQLRNDKVKESLIESIQQQKPFEISATISHPVIQPIILESTLAACLLTLWEGSKPFTDLLQTWQKIQPANPITLEPKNGSEIFQELTNFLMKLEIFLYVLLEG